MTVYIFYGMRRVESEMKVEIPDGHCVTYSSQEDEYYYGICPFRHRESNKSRLYSELPSHPDKVNTTMCGPYNREGLLCGICAKGYGPAVYSYDLKCAKCSVGKVVSLFLLLEFVPGALFLVIFQLSVTSGPLLGYVLFSILSSSTVLHLRLHRNTLIWCC